MTIKITIKNAGKTHELELADSDVGAQLKSLIQEKTLIPPQRQKILIKGGKVNDDTPLNSLDVSKPIMVLGVPDKEIPVKPVEKVLFMEDMNYPVSKIYEPSGLINLGNTCYLNSSLQALFRLGDVSSSVQSYSGSSSTFLSSLKNLFGQMTRQQVNVSPQLFLMMFRQDFPQFAETDQDGYRQQDAEEAFSQILAVLRKELNLDDDFRLTFKKTTKCLTVPDEPETVSYEDAYKLNCHIDIKVNFLRDGILNGIKETIERHNESVGSNVEYEVTQTLTRLPKYLTVHMVRFFWKQEIRIRSKILRKVQFPFELDLAEIVDPSIKAEKIEMRDKLHKVEKDIEDTVREFKKSKRDPALTPLEQQEEEALKIASIKQKYHDDVQSISPVDIDTAQENPSSVYELVAVITHQGQSIDSGHYQSFVKDDHDLDTDVWWKFNDNKVSKVNRDKIEQLAGGGESDSALVLLYKAVGLN